MTMSPANSFMRYPMTTPAPTVMPDVTQTVGPSHPPVSEMSDLGALKEDLTHLRKEARAECDKFWKLATKPHSVVGRARITASGIQIVYMGEGVPEEKLGLAPGTFPKTIEDAMDMMHPDDRERYRLSMQRSLATGEPYDITYRASDGRGGWRWIAGRAVPVSVSEGRYDEWLFASQDITSQKDVEETLSQSLTELVASRSELKAEQNKLWRLAANTFSLLGEARVTGQGVELVFFGDVSPQAKLGLAPEGDFSSVEGLLGLMHPDDVECFRQAVHRAIEGGAFLITYRMADGHGGWRWLKGRACSLEVRDGKHVRFLHDTIDVTEQKRAEEALQQTVAELQQVKAQLQNENRFLREEIGGDGKDGEIIGYNAALTRVLQQVDLVAPTAATVLIGGETGTGKELVARAIHQLSTRKNGLFVIVNCAALPPTLVESELFGHEKGAFTGANARRAGRFEQADKGTLFLDEIGELPIETQAKLLRVLQAGEYERVGGDKTLRVDVRVIAASNRDLERAVREGLFRSDLYHRLAVFPIHLPPLRERREDIPLLAAYIVARHSRKLGRRIDCIPDPVLERLSAYDWPGNVRELENVLERAIILTSGTSLQLESILLGATQAGRTQGSHAGKEPSPGHPATGTMLDCEREHILRVCESTRWKIKGSDGAAHILGLNPGTLYSRMRKIGIRRP